MLARATPSAGLRGKSSGAARALMILGTASHVGKSLVAAAFCRLLAERGVRVAPFKAQNMALNSFVTREGGEIGRAQVAQAQAAGIEPHVDMNPVLLKPMDGVSQVVIEGSPCGVMSASEYYAQKEWVWPRVAAAYDRLAARFDHIVLEGAGSPVEINLIEHDLTNLRMARYARAQIVLVADIERGGVFAHLVGTWELLEPADRAHVVGFIINKFRGDARLLESGLAFLERRTGVPVLGILPFRADLQIDQEDSLGIDDTATRSEPGAHDLDVAVVRLPGLSNFTDVWPLSRVPELQVRYVERGTELGRPDLIVLPGTKTTIRDVHWLKRSGLAEQIIRRTADERGPVVLGICGGYQMLGSSIDDPLGVESANASAKGLGLLDVTTRFGVEKARHRVSGRVGEGGPVVTGYEIHMGETIRGDAVRPWITLVRERDGTVVPDGAQNRAGTVFGTYLHGLFDSLPFTIALVDELRRRRGLSRLDGSGWQAHREVLGARYAGLAALLREHVDLSWLAPSDEPDQSVKRPSTRVHGPG